MVSMNILMNYKHFLKAVSYVDQQFFSKPYSITPIIERWFNQLAMIELDDGRLIHLSNKIALKHVDIFLDETLVSKQDLALLFKYRSNESQFDKEMGGLEKEIQTLKEEINNSHKNETRLTQKLNELEIQFKQLNTDKLKANHLFQAIIKTGKTVLNKQALETYYGSKIRKIIYKPNHGLTHSVRVAHYINTIHAFKNQYEKESIELTDKDREKLQYMMLFSVVGRQDESGFNDTKARSVYQEFRVTSGLEFKLYAKQHLTHLYNNDIKALYRDAIIVQLMGYSDIEKSIADKPELSALFIDYVIEMEHQLNREISEEQALLLINQKKYSLNELFPLGRIRNTADAKLHMMNKAHALDLIRCYPLNALTENGPETLPVINDYLTLSGFYAHSDATRLESVFKILRYSFDTLALTGQNSSFGLLSENEFQMQKESILFDIQKIKEQFTDPLDPDIKEELLKQAKKNEPLLKKYWLYQENEESKFLTSYRNVLILNQIACRLTDAPRLQSQNSMFHFQHADKEAPHLIDHHKNAVNLLNALQSITPIPGVSKVTFPVISEVFHDRSQNKVTLVFDELEQVTEFNETYSSLFHSQLLSTVNSKGQYLITFNRMHYLKLLNDKLIEFKKVTIPKKIDLNLSFIDNHGNLEALQLITESRGLARLISTTPLNGENFPDYDYFLRALDNPIEERYTAQLKEFDNFPLELDRYYDPRNAENYPRVRNNSESPEVRFQEPITHSQKLTDKRADGWILGKPGRQKNTIFTKKLSHSLLPPHGKVKAFTGYPGKKNHFFPIGILSDLNQVDLKDERYVWTEGMDTFVKIWIRNTEHLNKKLYSLLNAKLDSQGNPIKSTVTNDVLLEQSKLQQFSTADALIEHLKNTHTLLIKKLNNKFFRPTGLAIQNFKNLLDQEKRVYLRYFDSFPQLRIQLEDSYHILEHRLNEETKRKHPKYAISLQKLIQHQRNTPGITTHNEILAGNTKKAVRAFYASKDQLFDRLNLAYHALEIKKKYDYQVPLLILSEDKLPYHYTEAMIKVDLKNAYQLLQQDKFPYDRTLEVAYVLGPDGHALFDKGKPVFKRTADNRVVHEPKDLNYQQELLVNLFQIGLPEITQIKQLSTKNKLKEQDLNLAIDTIISDMNVLGGLASEMKLIEEQFTNQSNVEKQQAFFLREVALGHTSLLKILLENKEFQLSLPLLNRALTITKNNKNLELETFLLQNANLSSQKIPSHIVSDQESLNTFLLLKEFKQDSIAESYLNSKETLHNPKCLDELAVKCKQSIDEIKQHSCGFNDNITADYCETLLAEIELHKDNYLVLSMHWSKMQAILEAITSPEMIAVKEQISRLETMSSWFFSAGSHQKANRIRNALSQVPLLERAHVFTNTKNSACYEVQIALASHRISWTNPLNADNGIDQENASKSFQDIAKKFKR